ncbi:hypothetical protein [Allonocardiopsis opalescens]|uniref:Uncharacterized protein n=1 Tax=Allonocardiopsis opalescens TaxID=1144618 RepID=A0A2T0Q776_9ACTN|nr:hypothetical protein [Allonocardiopsis opalescens]PRX99685.1 hypothetical protein CLV72_103290 [Allonocardiopsis opalescens]
MVDRAGGTGGGADAVRTREAGAEAPRRARWALALMLLVLAPIGAEYAVGYDSSTGNPVALATGLLILAPLYGAPALLIHELARRFGLRWPGILALAAAFGLLQAGVIDQSLFSMADPRIGSWNEQLLPTLIEPLGFAGYNALNFVVGHTVWSFGIPIALVEAAGPRLGRRPWLRLPGLVLAVLLYLAAAALILSEVVPGTGASAAQLAGSLAAVAVLAGYAFTLGRRAPRPRPDGRVPAPLVLSLLGLVAGFAFNLAPETWAGVAFGAAVLAATAWAVSRLARSPRWSGAHTAALAAGALAARALIGYLADPIGEVPQAAQYAHNTVMVLGAVLLGTWLVRRNRRRDTAA